MGAVAKYNTFKGVSTVLTVGTPIATLLCCGDMFVHRSDTAISVAGIFAAIIMLLIFKDKIAENWKMPSALVTSIVILVFTLLIEKILFPIKLVCITTIAATSCDELLFKRFYKRLEKLFPAEAASYKHFGFIFTSTTTLNQYKQGGTP